MTTWTLQDGADKSNKCRQAAPTHDLQVGVEAKQSLEHSAMHSTSHSLAS